MLEFTLTLGMSVAVFVSMIPIGIMPTKTATDNKGVKCSHRGNFLLRAFQIMHAF